MRTALIAAALLLPAAAAAGPSASLRLAYAPAVGNVAEAVPMSDMMRSHVPLQLDLGWRTGPFAVGGYVAWGVGQVPSRACAGADCSASALHVGAQALYTLAPLGPGGIVPWGGVGLGWERAALRRERLGSGTTWVYTGLEAIFQAGADWQVAPRFAVGPFAQLALGRYGDMSLETSGASASADLAAKALHAWIHVGVRGTVDL
jgi:hypothetical protein